MISTTYRSLLQQHAIQPLFDLLNDSIVPRPDLEELFSDILSANDDALQPLLPWLEAGQPKYKILVLSPSELAFDILTRQEKDWLNFHSLYFERKFEQALVERDQTVLAHLKSLIAQAYAGVNAIFLQELLQNPPVPLSQIDELDVWILRVKLHEHTSDDITLMGLKHELGEQLEKRPWLLIVLIYMFREKNPFVALDLLYQWDEITYQPSEEIKAYAAVYLRHAIYNFLHEGNEENYNQYLSLFYDLKTPYIQELLQNTLKHESLQDIAHACDLQVRAQKVVMNITLIDK